MTFGNWYETQIFKRFRRKESNLNRVQPATSDAAIADPEHIRLDGAHERQLAHVKLDTSLEQLAHPRALNGEQTAIVDPFQSHVGARAPRARLGLLQMSVVLVGTAGVRDHVQVVARRGRHDQVVENTALVVGEHGERARVRFESAYVGDRETLDESICFLFVCSFSIILD